MTSALLAMAVLSLTACGTRRDRDRHHDGGMVQAEEERTWEGTGAAGDDLEAEDDVRFSPREDEIQREEDMTGSEDIQRAEDSEVRSDDLGTAAGSGMGTGGEFGSDRDSEVGTGVRAGAGTRSSDVYDAEAQEDEALDEDSSY
jgi:hypothetical protein